MKTTPAVAAVSALLVLLTWLASRAIDTDAERYDRALKALDRFAVIEITLHRDVLSARAGMLRNYDPLVQEVDDLREALGRLHDNASEDREAAAAIDRFATAAALQEQLTEQFKSDNALLQNSLAFFQLLSTRLSASDGSGPLAPAVGGLTAAMLQLTIDTSSAAAREVADRLSALAAQPLASADAGAVRALMAHGELLHDLLPVTDGVLRALLAAPNKRELKALRTMILTRQTASRATAREFRLLLYATSVLLLGVLVHFGLRLRARAFALRRRAAFEHVMAGISTRLIDAHRVVSCRVEGRQRQEIDAQIDRALAELAKLVDADRAYIMVSGNLNRMYRWCREGITFPPSWPDRVSALVARLGETAEGIIHVPSVDRLPPGTDKDVLAAAMRLDRVENGVPTSSPSEGRRGALNLGIESGQ